MPDASAPLPARLSCLVVHQSQSFKLWIFVLHQEENLRRANAYAQAVHQVDTWGKLVDWEVGQA